MIFNRIARKASCCVSIAASGTGDSVPKSHSSKWTIFKQFTHQQVRNKTSFFAIRTDCFFIISYIHIGFAEFILEIYTKKTELDQTCNLEHSKRTTKEAFVLADCFFIVLFPRTHKSNSRVQRSLAYMIMIKKTQNKREWEWIGTWAKNCFLFSFFYGLFAFFPFYWAVFFSLSSLMFVYYLSVWTEIEKRKKTQYRTATDDVPFWKESVFFSNTKPMMIQFLVYVVVFFQTSFELPKNKSSSQEKTRC